MARKRFTKLMRATMVECYALNEKNGGNSVTAKALEDSFRSYKLPEGKSYAEAWEAVSKCLKGIVSTCK